MKKACFFIGAPGGEGAVAAHFVALGQELAGRGNIVKVFAQADVVNGMAHENNFSTLVWPSPRPTRIADAVFLARAIRKHRPDCLVANFAAVNWMCLLGWFFRVDCRLAFYHTLQAQINSDTSARPRLWRSLMTLRKRVVYKTATGVVGISQAALRDAQGTYGVPARKCSLWRYSMPDPARLFPLLGSDRRENLVVCAARLMPSKGQDVLISALALASGAAASVRVEFLGTGPALESLRRLAEAKGVAARCHFVGLVSHDQVLARMAHAQVTILPSRQEAFGLVNVESMSVGTPVIASHLDGIREIIRDGLDGFLVPPGDAEALAEKLSLLIEDQDLRQRLGRSARQRFLETYEDTSVVRKQADWLEQLVQPPGQRINHAT